ncbi:MAG TPA: type I restriction endonuclease subunit R [Fimbriimonadaceae bacterium]|nr:type I restriction endonuclease subunit R [Fimbriimonadaceae bacterium]
MTNPKERLVEDIASLYLSGVGYVVATGAEIADSKASGGAQTGLREKLRHAVAIHNNGLGAQQTATVANFAFSASQLSLVANNRWMHDLLMEGLPIESRDSSDELRTVRARYFDFDTPSSNEFLLVRQLSLQGANGQIIRPDLVLFVNGLPLVVIELKDPADESATLNKAIAQIDRYKQAVPDLFVSNLLCVVSDGLLTRVGSITSGPQRYMPWRPAAGGLPSLEALIKELLAPEPLLDYLQHCVAFEEDPYGNIEKKIAGYHQFRAMRKARRSVLSVLKPPFGTNESDEAGKGGVVWHTQGSGKSLTMLMLAGALIRDPEMKNPTIVVVTDRNDLDDQLFQTFAMGRGLLREEPIQAESRDHLRKLLDRAAGGVVFTTIFKFTEEHGKISDRSNVVVIADEAHRSQYGFVEGGAKWMRDALPNATFVGFTGTPIDRADKSTRRVFGDYADIYDIRQAVEDGATVPIYYEPRIVKLTVNEEEAAKAEKLVEEAAVADDNGLEEPPSVRIALEGLVGAPERVAKVAAFIVEHWEKRRAAMEGKAMVVTMSRDIAARLYEEIRKLRPDWHNDDLDKGAMKVVMTSGGTDEGLLLNHAYSQADRKRLAERFKNPADDFRLAIVVDMWLTGFDVPCAHTMYLDKPLVGHNLMQAIARVNRVYGEKPGGLVVDLLGLADQLADALAVYANATGEDEAPFRSVQEQAVPAMQNAYQELRSFMTAIDYASALDAPPADVLQVYLRAINHVLAQDDGWKRFRDMVKRLATAFALAVPRQETDEIAPHLAFFQRIAAMIRKRLADDLDAPSAGSRADVDAAVRQVLGSAVAAGEVIDLFAVAGLEEARLDVLSDEFLQRVSALEQKNIALETLRKLLSDEIRSSERKNLVQSKNFRKALEDAMLAYTNKQISTAEMIARLIELAKWVREAKTHGVELGLDEEETAFYDALAENGSAKDVMKSDTLRLMARELAEMVKKLPKLDWTQRESVQADLRRQVRRLLARYGYPPDLSEDATQLVLRQAVLSTESHI